MEKIKYAAGDLKTMRKIHKLFSQIDELVNSLSNDTRDQLLKFHNEDASVPHCARWGEQAADELTRKENYSITKQR